jgi:uncharacterized cupredoxin-like copper-binding protein
VHHSKEGQEKMLFKTLALAGLGMAAFASIVLAGGIGHSHDEFAFGEPGDPDKPSRTVTIIMKEGDGGMAFEPDRLIVRKGEQIRFVMRNHGASDHEFVLGTPEEIAAHAEEMRKNPDMEHDDPNSRRLASSENADLYWRFTKEGHFEFGCLIPGHLEAGMVGKVEVR